VAISYGNEPVTGKDLIFLPFAFVFLSVLCGYEILPLVLLFPITRSPAHRMFRCRNSGNLLVQASIRENME
jgi:hypothetical protein